MIGVSRNAWNNVGIGMALKSRRRFGVTLDWVSVGHEALMLHHLMMQIERIGAEESQSPGQIKVMRLPTPP